MYLFIFESIGTSELLMIGAVALIIFGPRKLPQMAKTLGKAMAEFKNTTSEFKSTWEREVNFETNNIAQPSINPPGENENKMLRQIETETNLKEVSPEIKEIDASHFNIKKADVNQTKQKSIEESQTEKQNWL